LVIVRLFSLIEPFTVIVSPDAAAAEWADEIEVYVHPLGHTSRVAPHATRGEKTPNRSTDGSTVDLARKPPPA
jgi:hypothetical protein